MAQKTCNECNIKKDIDFFSKNGNGFRSKCKECTNKLYKTREKNVVIHEVPKEGVFTCSTCKTNKDVKMFTNDTRSSRGIRYACRDCENKKRREKNHINLEKSRQKYREQSRKRREDVKNRIRLNLGTRLYLAVQKKHGNTMELTGCSKDELFTHLESKFIDGMNWENYGVWHIDHIKPCASFDLTDPEEQKKCFHWTNLQPLWAIDNMRKGANYVSVAELGSRHQA